MTAQFGQPMEVMFFTSALTIAALAAGLTVAQAATPAPSDYPSRPLGLITGFLPGGISDTLARVVGEKLAERLGQRVIIDGRPGAGGMISLEIAAAATPDGHTLLLGTPAVTISPNFKRKLTFDPLQSYAAVTMLGSSPTIAVVHPSVAANSIKDLIAQAIIARLNSEINQVLAMPDVRERLSSQGVEIAGSSPAELAAFIKTDVARWAKLVQDAGIHLE